MRDDENNTLKRIKQQTIALCTRHGKQYDGKSYWTWVLYLGNTPVERSSSSYRGSFLSKSCSLSCGANYVQLDPANYHVYSHY